MLLNGPKASSRHRQSLVYGVTNPLREEGQFLGARKLIVKHLSLFGGKPSTLEIPQWLGFGQIPAPGISPISRFKTSLMLGK